MSPDVEGFLYPVVDRQRCVDCGICLRDCPIERLPRHNPLLAAYGAFAHSDELRKDSSSGGIFGLLAQCVIQKGGVVYGAAFGENFQVLHKRIHCLEEIPVLRKTKYVQSKMGNSFEKVRQDLQAGLSVLFSGTPCQVAGLKAFLQIEYDNLLTVETICFGVPSPEIWRKYLAEKCSQYSSEVTQVSFRDKSQGWQGYRMRIWFANGVEYLQNRKKDEYMMCFSQCLSLRPSCYECKFKGTHREADLTLGDFWGVEELAPHLNDNLGTSLVLTHTVAGEQALKSLGGSSVIQKVEETSVLAHNPYALRSVPRPARRSLFFEALSHRTLKECVLAFARPSLWQRVLRGAKQGLHGFKRCLLGRAR